MTLKVKSRKNFGSIQIAQEFFPSKLKFSCWICFLFISHILDSAVVGNEK